MILCRWMRMRHQWMNTRLYMCTWQMRPMCFSAVLLMFRVLSRLFTNNKCHCHARLMPIWWWRVCVRYYISSKLNINIQIWQSRKLEWKMYTPGIKYEWRSKTGIVWNLIWKFDAFESKIHNFSFKNSISNNV